MNLKQAGEAFKNARIAERRTASILYEQIRLEVAQGMTETQAAKIAQVDRMTIRRALGKL